MGSFGDGNHSKNDNPAMNWVKVICDDYNNACARRAAAAPLRLRLLAAIGLPGPHYKWQMTEPLYKYTERK